MIIDSSEVWNESDKDIITDPNIDDYTAREDRTGVLVNCIFLT